jgi:hypothetical protein
MPAASSAPYRHSQYTPVASMATERTPWSRSQSISVDTSWVMVPKTRGVSPAMDTCNFSLPTSMPVARSSNTGSVFICGQRARQTQKWKQTYPAGS